MAAVFNHVFDLFDRVLSTGKKQDILHWISERRHYFVSSVNQNVSACFSCMKIGAVFEVGLIAELAILSDLVFLL